MIYFSLTPVSPLVLLGYVFGSHKCPTLASEILQPVLGFLFFQQFNKISIQNALGLQ